MRPRLKAHSYKQPSTQGEIKKIQQLLPRLLTIDSTQQHNLTSYVKSMNRILQKIGSSTPCENFQVQQQEAKNYKKIRYMQLKKQYGSKRKQLPFEFEIDQIALDCFDYDIQRGRTSVWEKYRSNLDELSYRTLKIRKDTMHKRKSQA